MNDWEVLEHLWNTVVSSETTFGASTGVWHVRKEYDGHGLAPMAEGPDVVAVYYITTNDRDKVGQWPLEEVAEYE